MNTLEQMAGLDQMGYPDEMMYPQDPMLQAGYMEDDPMMMEQMGMSPMEDPYAMMGMDSPYGAGEGQMLAQQMLGGPSPQLGQDEINALAYSLGLGGDEGVLLGGYQDPMYSSRFDAMNFGGM